MRLGALALCLLAGCQLVLGLDDPQPADVDALPAGQCRDGATVRSIVPPTGGDLFVRELMPDPAVADDDHGAWIELYAAAAIDLAGAELTDTVTTQTFGADGDCLHLDAGEFALLARSADAALNGGLPTVDAPLELALPSTGRVELHAVGGALFHYVDFANAPVGRSLIVDDPKVCVAPAGTPTYNGTDVGTPRADNAAACP